MEGCKKLREIEKAGMRACVGSAHGQEGLDSFDKSFVERPSKTRLERSIEFMRAKGEGGPPL